MGLFNIGILLLILTPFAICIFSGIMAILIVWILSKTGYFS